MVYCGTSGWNYNHWRGVFYHEGLPQSKWLEHYAAHFDTVEVNNSFYRLPDTDRRLVRKPCYSLFPLLRFPACRTKLMHATLR